MDDRTEPEPTLTSTERMGYFAHLDECLSTLAPLRSNLRAYSLAPNVLQAINADDLEEILLAWLKAVEALEGCLKRTLPHHAK